MPEHAETNGQLGAAALLQRKRSTSNVCSSICAHPCCLRMSVIAATMLKQLDTVGRGALATY